MSEVLEILRNSGGTDCEIPTLEIICSAWTPVFICAGFEDHTCTLEDARVVTFIASGLDVSLPKNNNDGSQSLGVAIDNVTGEAQKLVDAANAAGVGIQLIYRTYLESDKTAPAEMPIILDVIKVEIEGPTVSFTAGYFDLINSAWPRVRYTADFAPGLRYIT